MTALILTSLLVVFLFAKVVAAIVTTPRISEKYVRLESNI